MLKSMPKHGQAWPELKTEMINRGSGDAKWREGKTAVYVFNAGEDVARVQKEAYTLYMSENGLGPAAFPSLKQMEDEVIGMGLSLLHAPETGVGSITSGGTDSITMAIKAARDYHRSKHPSPAIQKLNIVAPFSAHPAFDKAAQMMDLELRRIACGPNLLADPAAMSAAIDANTMMIVGSAPCFPYGLIDPIEALGQIAERENKWLHVDACVGGYIAPFVRMNGAASVLFRSEDLMAHMIFDCDGWPGGRMITPTLSGTRPGGAISAAWAVMNYLGIEGYKSKQKMVTDARETIEEGVTALGFEILGTPQVGIVAFSHPTENVYAIYKQMYKRGWFTSLTTEPRSLHLMLSPFHAEVTDIYLMDLKNSLEQVMSGDTDAVTESRYS